MGLSLLHFGLALHAVLQVLDRLGTLHLVRHAVTQQMPQPDTAFNLGAAHAPMSRHLKVRSLRFAFMTRKPLPRNLRCTKIWGRHCQLYIAL